MTPGEWQSSIGKPLPPFITVVVVVVVVEDVVVVDVVVVVDLEEELNLDLGKLEQEESPSASQAHPPTSPFR